MRKARRDKQEEGRNEKIKWRRQQNEKRSEVRSGNLSNRGNIED